MPRRLKLLLQVKDIGVLHQQGGYNLGKLTISFVPVGLVDLIYPMAEECLIKVIEKAPDDISLETIKADLLSLSTMMVTVSDGPKIVAINILQKESMMTGHNVLFIPITGGERMSEWLDDFMAIAHRMARDLDCHELRGLSCRKGWITALKKHDWYPIHQVIGCKVKEEDA